MTETISALFDTPLQVVNIGIGTFAETLRQQEVPVVELDWQPPAGGNTALVEILKQTDGTRGLAEKIDAANRQAIERILASQPQVVDVQPAAQALGLTGRTILHAGPPIAWEGMCGPQKRAVLGAIRFEGWAEDNAAAEKLVESGQVSLSPNHRYRAVGPMTGIISPSMPVLVVRNEAFGNYGFSTFNEGRGNTLWFGLCDEATLERLAWIRDTLAPAVAAALRQGGPLNVFDIVAQGLQMGDECHARSAACTSLLVKTLLPPMLEAGVAGETAAGIVRFMANNNHFFLNFTMAAVKATMDAAHGIPYSTLVTAMARNGVDFALRVGGLGDEWLVAPVSPMDEAVYYTGYSVADAAGDIGDSAIIETCGLGGMAIAGAPTIAAFVGGSLAAEIAAVEELRLITLAAHRKFSLPPMNAANTPLGIDVRRVVETRIVPFITTGVLHETSPTVGQIGTGVARAPLAVFEKALAALAHKWGLSTSLPEPETVLLRK
ncbi:MAG: hypothetical protein DPW09_11875 [Anaerolineae bacterium]|nr:DUF1116 domain-containing protein [Anaerolineales bacterium]MCQ3974136.1 hypothetical protein [Anaerolineae bacterium]